MFRWKPYFDGFCEIREFDELKVCARKLTAKNEFDKQTLWAQTNNTRL
ncbi:4293_t:CDS:1, partial [Racocetra persica]